MLPAGFFIKVSVYIENEDLLIYAKNALQKSGVIPESFA